MTIPAYPQSNSEKPPLASSVKFVDARTRWVEDSAAYVLQPDTAFPRPYLAIPGTPRAFIWPLGVEGFELASNATLGLHRYLGEVELDVSIVHKDEMHIRLSGVFPGWTSVENMNALRAIFDADTPQRGKILHLPLILPQLQFVVGETMTFNHAEDDRTQDIVYNLSFVKTGNRPYKKGERPKQPPNVGPAKSAGKRLFVSNAKYNTLRKIAYKVFRNGLRWTQLYTVNHKWYDSRHIPTHKVPDYRLPNGTRIRY